MTDEDRRLHERHDSELSVDYASGETFLFSYITNISEMGIFIRTDNPAPIGTKLRLRFGLDNEKPLSLAGEVIWLNPLRPDGDNLNPGMGIRFEELTLEQREKVVGIVRSIAYLTDDQSAD